MSETGEFAAGPSTAVSVVHIPPVSHGIVWVEKRPVRASFTPRSWTRTGDGTGIGNGPGQAVEFGYPQGVALAHGGQGLIEARSGAAGSAATG